MPASSMKNKGGRKSPTAFFTHKSSLSRRSVNVLQIYDRILPNQSYGTATLLLAGAALAVAMEA